MPLIRNGWTLLFHRQLIGQLERLSQAADRARAADPAGHGSNANVRTFRALARLILDVIPADPGHADFRQGNTLGTAHRHWFRAKFGGRFRLFYRFDSRSRIIVFAWVIGETTLRNAGARTDPYAVFREMLSRGNPPDEWKRLLEAAEDAPPSLTSFNP